MADLPVIGKIKIGESKAHHPGHGSCLCSAVSSRQLFFFLTKQIDLKLHALAREVVNYMYLKYF